jgi:hypothetical protein
MPETPEQLYERVQGEGLRMPQVEEWESWPFDGESQPRALQPPEERERPRLGEDEAECWRCQSGEEQAIWSDEQWLLTPIPEPNGLPCVVSDRGGNEEAVTNGRNGRVVPAQNVERLVDALDSINADEPLRRRMASAALDTAREFDIAATVARTERILLCGTQTEELVQSPAAFGQVERP